MRRRRRFLVGEYALLKSRNAAEVNMTAAIRSDDRNVSEVAVRNIVAASVASGASRSTSMRLITAIKVVSRPVQAGGKNLKVEAKAKAAEVVSGRMPPTDAKVVKQTRALIGATTVVENGRVARPEKERGGQLSRPNH